MESSENDLKMSNNTTEEEKRMDEKNMGEAEPQPCKICGEVEKCNCIEEFLPLQNAEGEVKYYIKRKLNTIEAEQIYIDTVDVFLDGAKSGGEEVKDYRSQTGMNKRTAIRYLKEQLLEHCVKDYDFNKMDDYLADRVVEHIMRNTLRANDIYMDLTVYMNDSSTLSAIANRVLDEIPKLLNSKELKKLLKDASKEMKKASDKYEKVTGIDIGKEMEKEKNM